MGQHQSRDLPDEVKEKYPHLEDFKECQRKAFSYGMYSLVAGAASIFVVQDMVKKYLPYDRKYFLFAPVLGASAVSYYLTRKWTQDCQNMWMAAEGKHTALSPVSDKRQDASSSSNLTESSTARPV